MALLLSTEPHRSSHSADLIHGIHDALAEKDLHLTLARLTDAKLTDRGYVPKILKQCLSDGLLINYFDRIPGELVKLIACHNLPAVWMNSRQAERCICPDDEGAAAEATERLLGMGHERIVYVNHSGGTHYSAESRRSGYATAMEAAGLTPVVEVNPLPRADRFEAARRWLGVAARDRPTAVVAYSATSAWPAREAAISLGLAVPEDLSLVTFASQAADETGFQIDTALVPEAEPGRRSVEMLLALIAEPETPQPTQVLPFGFAPGRSIAPPA